MNYKVYSSFIFKWHKRFREGREHLEHANVRWHNLAEPLMDTCMNKGAEQHQEM